MYILSSILEGLTALGKKFVLRWLLCTAFCSHPLSALLQGFFSGFSGFPRHPSQKPTFPNSNSTRIDDPHESQLRLT